MVGKDLKSFGDGDASADPARAFVLRKGRNTLQALTKSNSSKKFLNTVLESFQKSLKSTSQARIAWQPHCCSGRSCGQWSQKHAVNVDVHMPCACMVITTLLLHA